VYKNVPDKNNNGLQEFALSPRLYEVQPMEEFNPIVLKNPGKNLRAYTLSGESSCAYKEGFSFNYY